MSDFEMTRLSRHLLQTQWSNEGPIEKIFCKHSGPIEKREKKLGVEDNWRLNLPSKEKKIRKVKASNFVANGQLRSKVIRFHFVSEV